MKLNNDNDIEYLVFYVLFDEGPMSKDRIIQKFFVMCNNSIVDEALQNLVEHGIVEYNKDGIYNIKREFWNKSVEKLKV